MYSAQSASVGMSDPFFKAEIILIVKDGATTGRVGFVTDDEPCVILSSVAILRGNKCLRNKYLMYLMESEYMQSQIRVSMAGSAMPRTILAKIVNYYGLLCPLSEQDEIVAFLDKKCKTAYYIERSMVLR